MTFGSSSRGITKTYHVVFAIPIDIGHHPGMCFHTPTTGAVTEGKEGKGHASSHLSEVLHSIFSEFRACLLLASDGIADLTNVLLPHRMMLNFYFNLLGQEYSMKKVTMLQFRRHAVKIIEQVRKGQRMILTYRGKPVVRFEPIDEASVDENDPFYHLDRLADSQGKSLTNRQIDRIVYET